MIEAARQLDVLGPGAVLPLPAAAVQVAQGVALHLGQAVVGDLCLVVEELSPFFEDELLVSIWIERMRAASVRRTTPPLPANENS